MKLLDFKNLSLSIGEKHLLANLSGTLKAGELHGLVGANGSGKTTLLRNACGLQNKYQGEILLHGQKLHEIAPALRAQQISIVLSQNASSLDLTVHELLQLGQLPWKKPNPKKIPEVMQALHLEELSSRLLHTLSDGEKHRAFLGRALVQSTPVLFLDEPCAHLDAGARVELMSFLRKWAKEHQMALFISLHEIHLAMEWCDKILVLEGDQKWSWDIPEALVLNGSLERSLKRHDLHWNAHKAKLTLKQTPKKFVQVLNLKKDALSETWTKVLLERKGYKVVSKSPITIEIHNDHWKYLEGENEFLFGSLAGLEKKLQ